MLYRHHPRGAVTGLSHRNRPGAYDCPGGRLAGLHVDEGTLDFSLIGILADISQVLAQAKVGIFVVSTFDTDYIFVKGQQLEKAISSLAQAGYEIVEHKSL